MFYDLVKHPLYLLIHPIKGFDDFKREKTGKIYVALIFLFLMSILSILRYTSLGFIINYNNPNDLNSIKQILIIVVPVLLFTVANWSITTLFDGKGKLKEIFMMMCYSFFPYIVLAFPNLILSNVITTQEIDFYFLINYVGIFLAAYMVFFGMINIHEYSVSKTILTTFATIIAIGVILFIFLLFFTLIQEFYSFLYSIYKELTLRYL